MIRLYTWTATVHLALIYGLLILFLIEPTLTEENYWKTFSLETGSEFLIYALVISPFICFTSALLLENNHYPKTNAILAILSIPFLLGLIIALGDVIYSVFMLEVN